MIVFKNGKIYDFKEDNESRITAIHQNGTKCTVDRWLHGGYFYKDENGKGVTKEYHTIGELIAHSIIHGFTPYIDGMQMSKSEINGGEL